ncbi:receptor-like kinase, partial [Trifolium medium]|nr:receptor-like kinase [Trifolium medium]
SRWGTGISPVCSTCGNGEETVIHVLRDSVQATQIWVRDFPSELQSLLFDDISGA